MENIENLKQEIEKLKARLATIRMERDIITYVLNTNIEPDTIWIVDKILSLDSDGEQDILDKIYQILK